MIIDNDALIPPTDNDTDTILNSLEDAGYNGGDTNGDGILDSLQPNIASTTTGGITTGIEVTNACQVLGALTNSTSESDPNYSYPSGFEAYSLTCAAPGQTATISLYFETSLTSTAGVVLRKFNPFTSGYSTISNPVLSIINIGGTNVLKAVYEVTDGGVLDMDLAGVPASVPVADGIIVDPVGL